MAVKMNVILSLIFALTGCGKVPPPPPPPLPKVVIQKAIAQDTPFVIRTIGQAVPFNSVEILPQVSGELLEYFFTDGAYVNEGDLLATIDPRIYLAQLEEAKGQLNQARSSLAYNLEVVRRYQELLPDDYVSILHFEEYLTNAEMSTAQVEQFEGTVGAAEINLGYTEIRAPLSGRTSQRIIDPGNIVFPEEKKPLVTINQITPIEVDFSIPERYFFDIKKHQNPQGLEVIASVVDQPDKQWTGKLFFYDNHINRKTGTLLCKAIYSNEDETLWPGLWVNVTVKLYTIADAILVPTQSIRTDTQGQYVFVVDESQNIQQRRVTLGQRFEDWQVIQSGVRAGEKVVSQGQSMLRPGMQVQIKETI